MHDYTTNPRLVHLQIAAASDGDHTTTTSTLLDSSLNFHTVATKLCSRRAGTHWARIALPPVPPIEAGGDAASSYYLRLLIAETYGSKQTYLNQVYVSLDGLDQSMSGRVLTDEGMSSSAC